MNVIKKFTIKSLKNNKKWTIVTIIGIIISTAMITAVITLTASFIDLMQKSTIEETGNWHAAFYNSKISDIEYIQKNEFTQAYMIRRSVGYAQLDVNQSPYKPYLYIEQYDNESMKKFPIHLISGRLPENDKEIIIPQHIESNTGIKYNVGDKLNLTVGKRMLPNGQKLMQNEFYRSPKENDDKNTETFFPENTIEYTVVGIMQKPEFESIWDPGYTVITYLNKEAFMPDDNIDIYMLLKKLDNSLDERINAISKEIGIDESNIDFNIPLLRYYGIIESDEIRKMFLIFSLVMIIIIMLASISLIYNAFDISVSERIKQLGMLASVGATKRQKRENVYFEGFIVGIIGIPLGIIAGLLGIGITIELVKPLISEFINYDYVQLQMVVSPMAILLTSLFAILTIIISVYIPAKHASKIMPIEAIRQSKEIKLTSKYIKTSKLTKILFGFEGELAMKNFKRSKKKYRSTIVSLTISIVLFLTVSTAAVYTKKSAEIRLETENINYDVSIELRNSDEKLRNKIYDNIIALDLVNDYSMVRRFFGATLVSPEFIPDIGKQIKLQEENGKYSYTTVLTAIGDEAFEKYVSSIGGRIKDFNDLSKPRGILVNRAVSFLPEEKRYIESKAINIRDGDSIPFTYSTDREGEISPSQNIDLVISNVTSQAPIGTITNQFGELLIVTSDTIFDSILKTQSFQETNTILAIKTSDGEKLDTQIKQIFKAYYVNDTNMFNSSIDARTQKRMFLVMGVFIYGFITLISLICVANIFNTVSTNIALRRKEFAMLRSVGMTPKSFKKMMNFESIFYGIKALINGLPISVVIGIILYQALEDTISFSFRLPWKDYVIAIILLFAIVSATMVYSETKLSKQNIIDALKDDSY